MKASDINWVAVRAFNRVYGPIAAELEQWAACDAQFDGGEWSGPANAVTAQRLYNAHLSRIAARFDLAPEELEEMDLMAANIQHDFLMDALNKKTKASG